MGQKVARPWAAGAFNALVNAGDSALSVFASLRDEVSSAVDRISESLNSLSITNLGVSLVLLALTTAVLLAVDISFEVEHLTFAFVLPIFLIAKRCGKMHAVIASAASCAFAAFYFYPPKFSILIDDPMHVAELASFCAIALMISKYVGARSSEVMAR